MTSKSGRVPAVPVPEELYGYEIPEDINAFLGKLLPNMRVLMARRGIKDPNSRNEAINNFIAYFLNTAPKHGHVLRYKLYDKVHGLEYYKFVLDRLGHFASSWKTEMYEDHRKYACGIIDSDTPREDIGPGKFINIDKRDAVEIEDDIVGVQTIEQIREYYAALQNAYAGVERGGAQRDKPMFESIALDLFDTLMDNHRNPVLMARIEAVMAEHGLSQIKAFARVFKVSDSAVTGWRKRMQESVIDMLGFDPRRKAIPA